MMNADTNTAMKANTSRIEVKMLRTVWNCSVCSSAATSWVITS